MLLSVQACPQAFQTSPGTAISALLTLKSSSPALLPPTLSPHPLLAKQPLFPSAPASCTPALPKGHSERLVTAIT